ncbi:MAG: hypothetical protein HZA15_01460 [Nitrospirae bacterium]|nr:hypothetical protein [Nitrospirota bacterium]
MNTAIREIEDIRGMLTLLSEPALQETRDFVQFLLEKQKKRKAFVDRVLKAEKETPIRYRSVDDAVKAIFDEADN